jgi:hypothetical protein
MMKNVYRLCIYLVCISLLISLISAADFVPQGNIDLKNIYGIKNGTYVNATIVKGTYIFGNGSGITGLTETDPYWTGNISSYFTSVQTINYINSNISSANNSVVNWVDLLFPQISELVGLLGNWSADKNNYYTKSEVTTNISTANTSMKNYVDSQDTIFNNSLKNYLDSQDLFFNSSLKNYTDALDTATNTSMKNYVDNNFYLDSNPDGFINWSKAANGTLLTTALFNSNYTTNDPIYRSFVGNYSAFLNKINWTQATNGTLMLASNWNATNTSYYLITNPYGFYNSTNPSPETLWNANYSTFLIIAGWNNTGLIRNWNSTGLIKDWNSTGYIKNWNTDITSANTSLKNWIDAQSFLTSYTETDPKWTANYSTFLTHITWAQATNGTLMSQATFNSNYSTNDGPYRNTTNDSYYLKTNPFGFYNSTTLPPAGAESDPLWTGNQSSYFNKTDILGFDYYNSTDFNIANYPTLSTILGFGYYNGTSFSIGDYYTKTQINGFSYFNSTNFPFTHLSNFTDNLGARGYTHLSNFTDNLGNRGYTNLLNFTNGPGFYNVTTAPIYLNDTFRGSNYSTFLTHITWANAVNGTLMTQSTFNSNYSTNDPVYRSFANNYSDYLTTKNYALNDSRWTLNYSTFLTHIDWTKATNGTLALASNVPTNNNQLTNGNNYWNSTFATFNKTYADTLYMLTGNYSTFLTHISWANAVNGTLMSQATFNTNYTTNDAAYRSITNTSYLEKIGGTMTGNLNVSAANISVSQNNKICLEQTCAKYISYNGTAVVIQG